MVQPLKSADDWRMKQNAWACEYLSTQNILVMNIQIWDFSAQIL
jgi:hypothetical protein